MPVAKPDHGAFVNPNRNRKSKRNAVAPPAKARERPALRDIPAVVVRLRGRADPAELLNLPMRDNGADMVLHLIAAHPDACVMTADLECVRIGDIVRVDCPERGEILVDAARRTDAKTGPLKPIEVRIGTRNERVGIVNIPDAPEGRKLLREILEEYRSAIGGGPSGYTFFTTDHGYIPVWEVAAANKD